MNLGLSHVDDNLINLNLQHDWRSRTLRDVGVGGGDCSGRDLHLQGGSGEIPGVDGDRGCPSV